MTFRQIFTLTVLILISLGSYGQTRKKIFLFPECDTLKDSQYDWTLNIEIKSSDEQITDWLNKNSSGKRLVAGVDFSFILDNKKGVCCKKLTVFDSSKANVKDLIFLIQKLTDYPEFKLLANNSKQTKILQGVVYFDKTKNEYKIGLMLVH